MSNFTISLEDVRIGFRNFAGKGGQYNREGDRNFVIFLDPENADELSNMGLNIKMLPAREEGDTPQAFVKVAVGYQGKYPPKVALIKTDHMEYLDERTISLLDWAEIQHVDIIMNCSEWSVNGNSGIKPWVKSIYVTLIEDEFESKYADIMDSARICVGPDCPTE